MAKKRILSKIFSLILATTPFSVYASGDSVQLNIKQLFNDTGTIAGKLGAAEFPPFIENSQNPLNQNPNIAIDQRILGKWSTSASGVVQFYLEFQNNGKAKFFNNGTAGEIPFSANNGNMTLNNQNLTYTIENNVLRLSDGTVLLRYVDQTINQNPTQNQQGQIILKSPYIGTWVNVENNFILVLNENATFALTFGNQTAYGTYTIDNSSLNLTASNGKQTKLPINFNGNSIILDNLVLTRQSQNANIPSNNQTLTPMSSTINGSWYVYKIGTNSLDTNIYRLIYTFNNSEYSVSMNQSVIETGSFEQRPNGDFAYNIKTGQSAGKAGINKWRMEGADLIITPAGSTDPFYMKRLN